MNRMFNPRSALYKQPYGAVPSGEAVTLSVRVPRSRAARGVRLVAEFEQRGDTVETDLPWTELVYGRDVYTTCLDTADYSGLVWYYFQVDLDGRRVYLGPDGDGDAPPERGWQLTVYLADLEEVPWFSRGIAYQIFPDRFCRTRTYPLGPEKWLHENWDERPAHTPTWTEDGRENWNCDFFGGSLDGITSKLDYLEGLGVTVLYLNPIFEAFSNHRYDTGRYDRIDPLLGTEADFRRLCREAHRRGMRIILDGVFNHTGADSMYFNKNWTYEAMGACQSKDSPFYSWYTFQDYPKTYTSWWGIPSLPAVNELDPGYLDYIVRGENSIVRRWIRAGADGWRLDVADELPDPFIAELRRAVREENPEAIVIGEVWEDATNKIAYDVRRRHLWGGHLDAVMNYPFKDAAIGYLLNRDAGGFYEKMEALRENYPPAAFQNNMNFLGTHDTPRILTVLGTEQWPEGREAQAAYTLSREEYTLGKRRLKLAALLLMTFPGAPTIYYGDEAGVTGFADPFNRGTYPWGREDRDLMDWYRTLTALRQNLEPLRRGNIHYLKADGPVLAFTRRLGTERVLVAINAGDEPVEVTVPWYGDQAVDRLIHQHLYPRNGELSLQIPRYWGMVITRCAEG